MKITLLYTTDPDLGIKFELFQYVNKMFRHIQIATVKSQMREHLQTGVIIRHTPLHKMPHSNHVL